MARFNEILVGRYNRALQKISGIKGEAPAPQLASEIMPIFGMFYGVENRHLESWERYAAFSTAATGAAAFAQSQLLNPLGSGVIIVVEKLAMFAGGTETLRIMIVVKTGTALATAVVAQRLDSREPPASVGNVSSSTAGAGVIQSGAIDIARYAVLAHTTPEPPAPTILLPPESLFAF